MKLLTQPGDGVTALVNAISSAKQSVDIAIFRFDRKEIERAMINAVNRGVRVRALIACANRGGEKRLRDLEARLLGAGVTVARTADDLVRYHAKYLIVDRAELYVLAFNFTYIDIEQSRSFGIVTNDAAAVKEAGRLFEMDITRQPYTAGLDSLIVSPSNARRALGAYIGGAQKELYVYDPCVGDAAMIRALEERKNSGVEVKVLGHVTRQSAMLDVAKLRDLRLHTRVILRDRTHIFLGSQSLRTAELDRRREVGLIFEDAPIARSLRQTFLDDWRAAELARLEKDKKDGLPTNKVAKKVAKAVAKELPAIAPMIETAIQEMGAKTVELTLQPEELEDSVKDAVKHAVKAVVKDAVAMDTPVAQGKA